ncbi:MAG TPA: hypothetical protein VGC13_23880 [Longimicrobium sp.]|uniref:hypothetical protein n=1 Tax=Longimicrobium sp. TaxID=2029185 RepID=UPI002ED83213
MIRRPTPRLRRPLARRTLPLACAALFVLAAACGGKKPPPGQVAPAVSIAPMDLGGQRVLILPVQASSGLPFNREIITDEIVAAIHARDTRTQWIDPARLRRTLAGSPNFAPDPAALPNDRYEAYGARRIQGGLHDAVRRYMALTEARLVVIPRSATLVTPDSGAAFVRLSAAVVDARTGMLVWWGEADGAPGDPADRALVTSAATALAVRLLIPD